MTVHAVANPHNMHKQPEILHNRAVGFGLVTFNKKHRTIKTDCFQRVKNPLEIGSQYPGWPQTISQQDNFAKKAVAWLPELQIECTAFPVLKLYDGKGNLVYAIRLHSNTYRPKVFENGRYTIELSIPEWGFVKTLKNLKSSKLPEKTMSVTLNKPGI